MIELTTQELNLIIRLAQDGDKNAIHIIIQQFERMIYRLAHKRATFHISVNELSQDGRLELLRCIGVFDESRNIKFNTYVYNCVSLHLKKKAIRDFKYNKYQSLDVENEEGDNIYNLIPDKPIIDDINYSILKSDLERKISMMKNKRDSNALMLFVQGMKPWEIGQRKGINKNITNSIMAKLHKVFIS